MSINKFTNNMDDPLHTSVFAAASKTSGGVGATGPKSFNQRLHVERNRQNVNRYHDSMIANGRNLEQGYQRADSASSDRADQASAGYVRPNTIGMPQRRRSTGGRMNNVAKPVVGPRFSEPPTRGYNPYQ